MYKSDEINYLNAAILATDNFRGYKPVFDEDAFKDIPEDVLFGVEAEFDNDKFYQYRNNLHFAKYEVEAFNNSIEFSTGGVNSYRYYHKPNDEHFYPSELPKEGILSTVTLTNLDNQVISKYSLLGDKTKDIPGAKLGKYSVADLLKYKYCELYNPKVWVYMKLLGQLETFRIAKFISQHADIYSIKDGKIRFIWTGNRKDLPKYLAYYNVNNRLTFDLDNVFLSMPK